MKTSLARDLSNGMKISICVPLPGADLRLNSPPSLSNPFLHPSETIVAGSLDGENVESDAVIAQVRRAAFIALV